MKLQQLAVIFVIIVVPISMVLSMYTNNNIEVLEAQADFNDVLLSATNDAVYAYQMNTLRNGYSTVNDSKIRDISASVNSFFTSLASGLGSSGYSREDIEGYVPAMLFTLYDGYYLYGDYQNAVQIENGKQVYQTANSNSLQSRTGIKPFIYYTCEYTNGAGGNLDLVINYTLDNYITVMGTDNSGNIINISGYLINPSIVSNIHEASKTLIAHGVQIQSETLGEYIVAIDTIPRGDGQTGTEYISRDTEYFQFVYYNNQKYYFDPNANESRSSTYVNGVNFFRLNNNLRVYLTETEANGLAQFVLNDSNANYTQLDANNFLDCSAFKYYKEAVDFTNTFLGIVGGQSLEVVTDSFNNQLNYTSLSEDTGEEVPIHSRADYYDPSNHKITGVFNIGDNNDPEMESSLFNEHRMDVIISSIESNLMSIISNFNIHHNSGFEFALPVLSEEDWYTIANNVTIVSFMQGMPIGNYKYYSNYSIVANTKNKEFVSRYSILLRSRESGNRTETDGDPNGTYHDPRCLALNGLDTSITVDTSDLVGYNIIDYQQQLVSYDVVDSSSHQTTQTLTFYYYPHSGSGAYECAIGKDDILFTVDNLISGTEFHSTNDAYDSANWSQYEGEVANANVRKAYITALAREKYNLYKVNDYFDDYNP